MKSRLPILLVFLSFSIAYPASLKPSDKDLTLFQNTIDCVFSDSFSQAERLVSSYSDTIPGQPLYHLLYASILHSRMMDSEDYSRETDFMTNIDKAVEGLEKWIKLNPSDAWGYFLQGTAYGYKTIWQGQKGSWLKSMLTGLKAKGRFFDALEIDPHLYDCYTGIGSYHYWSSVKLRSIFPFLSDNRDEGLSELRLAADSSLISSKAAYTAYGWALLNEKKFQEATKVAEHLKEITDGGRSSLWLMAAVHWNWDDIRKAIEDYGLLTESLTRAGEQNYYNLIFCRYRRGNAYYILKNYNAAEAEFRILLSYDPPISVRIRHKKTYEKTEEALEKIAAKKQSEALPSDNSNR
jgi:tetratricopeptide (TPR) repeat protein